MRNKNDNDELFNMSVISDLIRLQQGNKYVIGFDSNELTPNYVLSIILTSNPKDLDRRDNDTVLFRNGMIGTACIQTQKNEKFVVLSWKTIESRKFKIDSINN